MNAKQKADIIKVIKSDAAIRFRYENTEGQTCAIGGLAKAAGLDFNLVMLGDQRITRESLSESEEITRLRSELVNHYGIDPYDLRAIQLINDRNAIRRTRQREIINYINNLPITAQGDEAAATTA